MKILMISMFSNHFFNWTEQLKDSGHEIYWVDVFDSNTHIHKIDFVHQIIGWRNKLDYPGRYWVKKNLPRFNKHINRINHKKLATIVAEKIEEIQPDVVQSFVLFSAAYPILPVMKKNKNIKWIYSAWGNDLNYMQQFPDELYKIKASLPHFDYMFADCTRDKFLAEKYGFKGKYLGTFPTGGGYDLSRNEDFMECFEERKNILIKGYEGMLGRARYIIEAISALQQELQPYTITIFGSSPELLEILDEKKITTWQNIHVMENVPHNEVKKLMGESLLYIGNCISDGMPNTLLEAIVFGAFPIQSNPGGATEELIQHELNGLLIEDPENSEEIKSLIERAINDKAFMRSTVRYNNEKVRPLLDRTLIKKQVLEKYKLVEKSIC